MSGDKYPPWSSITNNDQGLSSLAEDYLFSSAIDYTIVNSLVKVDVIMELILRLLFCGTGVTNAQPRDPRFKRGPVGTMEQKKR